MHTANFFSVTPSIRRLQSVNLKALWAVVVLHNRKSTEEDNTPIEFIKVNQDWGPASTLQSNYFICLQHWLKSTNFSPQHKTLFLLLTDKVNTLLVMTMFCSLTAARFSISECRPSCDLIYFYIYVSSNFFEHIKQHIMEDPNMQIK